LIVTEQVPAIEGCPVLQRLRAHVVKQGVCNVLEHQCVDPAARTSAGQALDLTDFLGESESDQDFATVQVRFREPLAFCSRSNPVFELEGEIVDLATGVLRVTLPSDLVEIAGVYEGSWALVNASDEIVYIGNSLLSVERSLFPASLTTLYRYKGPPTIQEIRLAIRDSGGPESLLLEDVQFGGEEILNAIVRTVSLWNELLPPVRSAVYTTRTFPFKEQWLRGIVAYLFLAAADYYRANYLRTSAGGLDTADKDKEQPYTVAGLRLLEEYRNWAILKKTSLNWKRCMGGIGSLYGRIRGGY
jgi:hypothetical protein